MRDPSSLNEWRADHGDWVLLLYVSFGGWWTIHVTYLSDGVGLVPNWGSRFRSDRDVVMGRALTPGSLLNMLPKPTLSLVGGLSLGSTFWAHTYVF